jgi:type VI secretion system protein ImpL
MEIINSLLPYLPLILTIIGVLILILVIYVVVLIVAAKKKQRQSDETNEAAVAKKAKKEAIASQKMLSANLARSFRQAIRMLRSETSGRNWRYQVPWLLAIGESNSGKTTALENVGLDLTLGKSDSKPGNKSICDWYFYDKGVMLDIDGSAILRKDGLPVDEKIWKTLLRLLQKHRPERPIDGIVLTIPATDLLAPIEESREILRAKADAIYKKLMQAQVLLGLCVPVYVVITKCDAISGFRTFAGALPEQFHEQMFGWSNPYALETAYTPRWIEEAFSSISGNLYETQIEVFSTQKMIDNPDELFMFASEFDTLLAPLTEYLSDIFKQSVYHEPLFFRGIYFTGDGSPAMLPHPDIAAMMSSEVHSTSTGSSDKITPFFLKELFEKKIFPEFNIARPITKVALTRNRTILITQIIISFIALFWGIGMYFGYYNLDERKNVLYPFLTVLSSTDTPQGTNQPAGMPRLTPIQPDKTEINESVVNAFLHYANTNDGKRLSSYFIPSSWFSPIHGKITECMTEKYDKFILKVLRYGLDKRANEVFALTKKTNSNLQVFSMFDKGTANLSTDEENSSYLQPIQRVDQFPAFINLRNFIDELSTLEKNCTDYNNLSKVGQGDLSDVNTLIKYLFKVDLATSFSNDQAYYFSKAVIQAKAEEFHAADYQKDAQAKLDYLSQKFFVNTFSSNPLIVRCNKIREYTDAIRNFASSGHDQQKDGLIPLRLYEILGELESALTRPEINWITSDALTLGASYTKITEALAHSQFIDMMEAKRFNENAEAGFQFLKSSLLAQKTAYNDLIFTTADKKITLSKEVKALKGLLESLLSQDFMRTVPAPSLALGTSNISWNVPLLEEVSGRIEISTQFVNKELPKFPLALQQPIQNIAMYQIETDARNRIVQAQSANGSLSIGTEESVKSEIDNFRDASGILIKLLTTFEQKRLVNAKKWLADALISQSNGLLYDINTQLESKKVYTIDDGKLQAWNGRGRTLSSIVFDARQEGELSDFVFAQQRLVKLFANNAKPLLNFLKNPSVRTTGENNATFDKWQKIISSIDYYDNKIPGSSLTALENFILIDLDSITIDNYITKTIKSFTKGDNDFFLDRLKAMKRTIYLRAQYLAEKEAVANYKSLQDYFNQHLAGKYPFVQSGFVQTQETVTADPDEIREFFKYVERLGIGKDALRQNTSYTQDSRNEMSRFLSVISGVRKFFNGFLSSDQKNPVLAYDADVEFRANRNQNGEVGSDQIIEWGLSLGNVRISNRDVERKGRWFWRTPVKLSLRWAKDAPSYPIQPAVPNSNYHVEPENKTAVFEFTNPWSLVQFIQEHRIRTPEDDDSENFSNQNLLQFTVPTASSGGATLSAEAKVFIKLNLYSPEKKYGLALPSFPSAAPKLIPEPLIQKN